MQKLGCNIGVLLLFSAVLFSACSHAAKKETTSYRSPAEDDYQPLFLICDFTVEDSFLPPPRDNRMKSYTNIIVPVSNDISSSQYIQIGDSSQVAFAYKGESSGDEGVINCFKDAKGPRRQRTCGWMPYSLEESWGRENNQQATCSIAAL